MVDVNCIRFGAFSFDLDEKQLFKDGQEVALRLKNREMLWALISQADRVVEKNELLETLWDGTAVQEQAVARCINELRAVFNDDSKSPTYIRTVAKRGYQWIYPLDKQTPEQSSNAASGINKWVWASLVTFSLLVAIALAYFAYKPEVAESLVAENERVSLLVLDCRNETGLAELESLSGMIITALEQRPGLSVMTRSRLLDALPAVGQPVSLPLDESQAVKLALETRTHAVVLPTIRHFDDHFYLDIKVLDPLTRNYLFASSRKGGNIPDMIDRLSEELNQQLFQGSSAPANAVAGLTTSNLKAYLVYYRGESLSAEGRVAEALAAYQQAIDLDANFSLAHFKSGHTLFLNGLINDSGVREHALKSYETALSKAENLPAKERALLQAEYAIVSQRDYNAALDILSKLEQRFPFEKDMLFFLGQCHYRGSRLKQAESYFSQVLSMDPNHVHALRLMVWTIRESGRFADCQPLAAEWHAVQPESPTAKALYGWCLAVNEDWQSGRQIVASALATAPGDGYITSLLFGLYFSHDRLQDVQQLEIAYDFPEVVQLYLGQYGKAKDFFSPDAYEARQESQVRRELGDLTKSLIDYWGYRQPLGLQSENPKPVAEHLVAPFEDKLDVMARYYWEQRLMLQVVNGDAKGARRIAALKGSLFATDEWQRFGDCMLAIVEGRPLDGIGRLPATPRFRTRVSLPLAWSLYEAGEPSEGLSLIEELQRTPDVHVDWARALFYPKSFYLQGRIYEDLGKPQEAAECYRRLLKMWQESDELPEKTDAKLRLARLTGQSQATAIR